MLRSLYVDNYKSLVNFGLAFERVQLFLGRNGSGKTAVFEVLARLREFILLGDELPGLFHAGTLTRWGRRTNQIFELVIGGATSEVFTYRLEVGHDQGPRVVTESLELDARRLFRREGRVARFFHPDGQERPERFIVDPQQSGLAAVGFEEDEADFKAFRGHLWRTSLIALDPRAMRPAGEREDSSPTRSLDNFASWYRHLAQERPDELRALSDDLRQVFGDEFRSLRLIHTGQSAARRLVTEWRVDARRAETKYELGFDELSEGQRALVGLYTLLHAPGEGSATLLLDEPDNYVALSEIQPWLGALEERPSLQVVLISHHPEIVDLLGPDAGLWFYRHGQGPTRVKPLRECVSPGETTSASELMKRGWIDADP